MTGKQKRYLRSLAHKLKPIINIGKAGNSTECLKQIQESLLSHELIKVKVLDSAPLNTKECAKAFAQLPDFEVVQKIGHTLVLYAAHPEEPSIVLPSV